MDSSFELELKLELEKLDKIFHEQHGSIPSPKPNSTTSPRRKKNPRMNSISMFELAAAEGDKEELEDKLNLLLAKTEEFDQQLMVYEKENENLRMKNQLILKENETLHKRIVELEYRVSLNRIEKEQANSTGLNDEKYSVLEYQLAETRAKLARALQAYEDVSLAKDVAIKELDHEKALRIHSEKEREAYSSAYEASLQHFERWSRLKQLMN